MQALSLQRAASSLHRTVPSRQSHVCFAKPKGGKASKGKGGKSAIADLLDKKKEKEAASVASPDQYRDPEVRALLLFVANSYYKWTKKFLVEADFDVLPDVLFNAPFALLVHNRFQEGVTEPEFIYANRAALTLFETDWNGLIGMPSKKSAADVKDIQEDRNGVLDKAATEGVILDYSGWRQSVKGTKFMLKGVTLFNVLDQDGQPIGQAAVCSEYETEDGKTVAIQGSEDATEAAVAAAAAQLPPTEEEMQAARDAVQQWADYVRTLKEVQGLTNKDPSVQEAVGNLQAWKTQLTTLEERLAAVLAANEAAFDDEDDDEE